MSNNLKNMNFGDFDELDDLDADLMAQMENFDLGGPKGPKEEIKKEIINEEEPKHRTISREW